jgi:hypothetical protein
LKKNDLACAETALTLHIFFAAIPSLRPYTLLPLKLLACLWQV